MLSLAASAVLFAGGDIAPVEPVAEAPAAACDDFYGFAGAGVIYVSSTNENDETESHATAAGFAVLGVTKEIVSGLTVNAEVQGASLLFYDGTNSTRHDAAGASLEQGSLTQLNLGYTWCNTAFKVGRFAVPGSLSPLAATKGSYFGLKANTFEGAMVANTDVPDTTIWAAYLYNNVSHPNSGWSGFGDVDASAAPGDKKYSIGSSTVTEINYVAGGFQNTSFADTTITLAAYYGIDSGNYMVGGDIVKKWCDTTINVGGAYKYIDESDPVLKTDAEDNGYYIGGVIIEQNFGSSYIKVGATYGDAEYKKYTDFTAHNGYAFHTGTNTWAIGANAGTTISGYTLYVAGDYQESETWEATVGVKKTFAGIDFALDYRRNSAEANRVRAKAVYNF